MDAGAQLTAPSTSRRAGVHRALLAFPATALAVGLLAAPATAAPSDGGLTFTGSLDERALSSIDANAPHRLDPDVGTVLSVEVRNDSDEPVEIRSVRLSATVLGLAFLNYTTRVDLLVEPGETGARTFALDLGDLGGQARGLLPGSVELLGPDRRVLVGQDVPIEVAGDLRSVYGVFGLGIAAITALLFLSLVIGLGAGRLPANRWSRAWRFAVPGIGLGLTATVSLSVLQLVLPSRTASLALVTAGALVGLAIGYLSPAPDDGTGREDLYEEDFAKVQDPGAQESRTQDAVAPPSPAEGLGGLRFSPPQQVTPGRPVTTPGDQPARPTQ